MSNITLVSSEGIQYQVDLEKAKVFGSIRRKLERNETQELVFALNEISSAILRRVIEWANHFTEQSENDIQNQSTQRTGNNQLTQWEEEFFNVNPKTMIKLILAAETLEVEPLKMGACQAFSDMLEDETFKEASKRFRLIQKRFQH